MAFVEDNLFTSGGICHHDELPTEDEDVSPTLENLAVLIWLQLTHLELPFLVKQRYGTELSSPTIASIKSEVSQPLDSLLEESSTQFQKPQYFQCCAPHCSLKGTCPISKQAGWKAFDHFSSTCPHLPESDRCFLIRARLVAALDEGNQSVCNLACDDSLEEKSCLITALLLCDVLKHLINSVTLHVSMCSATISHLRL